MAATHCLPDATAVSRGLRAVSRSEERRPRGRVRTFAGDLQSSISPKRVWSSRSETDFVWNQVKNGWVLYHVIITWPSQ